MNTQQELDAATIDALDFAPRCQMANVTVEHVATVAMMCRGCGRCVLVCEEHFQAVRAELISWVSGVYRRVRSITCSKCHRQSGSFEDAIEVVDL